MQGGCGWRRVVVATVVVAAAAWSGACASMPGARALAQPAADAPAETVEDDGPTGLEALRRRFGPFALGATVSTSRPVADDLRPRWAVGPTFRLGRGEGLGLAVGLNWFAADLGVAGGARVRVRPLMAGLGYTVRRDRLAVTGSLVGGYAFNSLGRPAGDAAAAVSTPVGVANSIALRPGVSVWRDLGERVALNLSLNYVITGLDVTYAEGGRLDTRAVSGNTAIVQVGIAYTIF